MQHFQATESRHLYIHECDIHISFKQYGERLFTIATFVDANYVRMASQPRSNTSPS